MTDGGLDYTFECIGNVVTMVSSNLGDNECFDVIVSNSVQLWRRVTKDGVCPL